MRFMLKIPHGRIRYQMDPVNRFGAGTCLVDWKGIDPTKGVEGGMCLPNQGKPWQDKE